MTSRKEQILNHSFKLFLKKGFDATSISDILQDLNIARGTLYYHFESKEAIMDAIIERFGQQAVESAAQVVVSDNLSVHDKLLGLFAAVQMGKLTGGEVMLDYLHRPQNSLFHEKSQQMILKKISPLLAQIIREGNLQNVFNNDFPEETAEMAVLIISGFIDSNLRETLPQRIEALLYNLEKMLGAKQGELSGLKELVT